MAYSSNNGLDINDGGFHHGGSLIFRHNFVGRDRMGQAVPDLVGILYYWYS